MKICSKCACNKPVDEFYTNKTIPVQPCKKCARAIMAQRHAANPEKKREVTRKWKVDNPERVRYNHVRLHYGLSPEEYDDLTKECAICGAVNNLHVDHNHKTGEVRGMLCNRHNLAIGLFNDDPNLLRRAIQYLLGELTTHVTDSIRKKAGLK